MTHYTDVPKANKQSKCVPYYILSEVLSSAKRILRVTDSKNKKTRISYIIAKIQYSLYDQTK